MQLVHQRDQDAKPSLGFTVARLHCKYSSACFAFNQGSAAFHCELSFLLLKPGDLI